MFFHHSPVTTTPQVEVWVWGSSNTEYPQHGTIIETPVPSTFESSHYEIQSTQLPTALLAFHDDMLSTSI